MRRFPIRLRRPPRVPRRPRVRPPASRPPRRLRVRPPASRPPRPPLSPRPTSLSSTSWRCWQASTGGWSRATGCATFRRCWAFPPMASTAVPPAPPTWPRCRSGASPPTAFHPYPPRPRPRPRPRRPRCPSTRRRCSCPPMAGTSVVRGSGCSSGSSGSAPTVTTGRQRGPPTWPRCRSGASPPTAFHPYPPRPSPRPRPSFRPRPSPRPRPCRRRQCPRRP